MHHIENCTVVILTGGESKRMGSDKALTKFQGQSLFSHVIEKVEPLFSEILISVHSLRADLKHRQIIDDAEARGPMVGIKRGLEEADTDWVFVIACDMPFVSTMLIQELASKRENFEAVVPFVHDRPQPLFGFYSKACLEKMEARMKQGQRSMIRLLGELDTYAMSEQQVLLIDADLKSLISLDTMKDVNKMECLK
ncbi:MAG: molybdenum cofactor guanylyltransferase [Mariprofundaceae bacterium]